MLTILHDPDAITGRERHAWDCTISMQANVERHLAVGGGCTVTLNGERIDPATDERLDLPPSAFDELVIVQRPNADPLTWAFVLAGTAAVVAYLATPKIVAPISGYAGAKDSPNNRLTAQTNVARAYQAIPDVYGYRRVWPDLIQPSEVYYDDHVKTIVEWMCVSRGKGTITDVRYAETPISDIDGGTVTTYQPASSPSWLPELNTTTTGTIIEPFASPEVNGQEISSTEEATITVPVAWSAGAGVDGGGYYWAFDLKDDGIDDLLALLPGDQVYVQLSVGGSLAWQRQCTLKGIGAAYDPASGIRDVGFSVYITDATSYDDVPDVSASFAFEPAKFTLATLASAPTVGPFTLPIADANRLRWNIVFLRGLKGTVRIRAEWWKIDEDGDEISGTRQHQDTDYAADTYDQRAWTMTINPAGGAGRYRVQFVRLTPDLDVGGADVAKLEAVYALRRFSSKTFPGVTLIKVKTRATEQATGISERKFNLRWKRHVRHLYSDDVDEGRNFGRAMAHVWTLAGEDLDDLDIDAIDAINDDLGGPEVPLLRFDGSLDDADVSLGERLQRIAYHARCVVWRDGTKWTVTREQQKPALVPEVQFDYRNLAAGGDSTLTYSAHLPASNDGVEVEYVDEDTQAKKAYVRLSVASGAVATGTPLHPLKIALSTGCTTLEQATNRAHLEARRLLYQRTAVSDTAMQDAAQLGVGSLCRWVDPNDFEADDGLQAGEVLAVSGTTVTLSEAVDFKSETSGRVTFTGTNGQPSAPVVCMPGTTEREIVVASVPSELYIANGTTQQASSRYAFAVGVSDAELQAAGLYVLTSASPASDRTYSIALANYDERIFAFDDGVVGPPLIDGYARPSWGLVAAGRVVLWRNISPSRTFVSTDNGRAFVVTGTADYGYSAGGCQVAALADGTYLSLDRQEPDWSGQYLGKVASMPTTAVESINSNTEDYKELGYPRTSTGAVIRFWALTSTDSYFWVVGEYAATTGPFGLRLFRASASGVFTEMGELSPMASDPNESSDSYYTWDYIATNGPLGFFKVGARWWMQNGYTAFYTDEADGLTEWRRADIGLEAGMSSTYLLAMRPILQVGGSLVAVRSDIALSSPVVSISDDAGDTWTASAPAIFSSDTTIPAAAAVGDTVYLYEVVDSVQTVAHSQEPFSTWTRSTVTGLPAGEEITDARGISTRVLVMTTSGNLFYSDDGIAFQASTYMF